MPIRASFGFGEDVCWTAVNRKLREQLYLLSGMRIERLPIYLYISAKPRGDSSHVSFPQTFIQWAHICLFPSSYNKNPCAGDTERLSSCVEISRQKGRFQSGSSEGQHSTQ